MYSLFMPKQYKFHGNKRVANNFLRKFERKSLHMEAAVITTTLLFHNRGGIVMFIYIKLQVLENPRYISPP